MRVLITNHSLDVRGGEEPFVRELARHLNARGHAVMAYGSDPSRGERLLEIDPIPVTTEPVKLETPPDIIHAQNPLDALTTLAVLPRTPLVYHLRADVWSNCPPVHPGIRHYLVETPGLADHLADHHRVPRKMISHFPEPVDLARFAEPMCLPKSPDRALWLTDMANAPEKLVTELMEVCRHRGIQLDGGGPDFTGGNESVLPCYPLVFASGRHAREALASGCAVVLTRGNIVGELIRPSNLDAACDSGFFPGEAADIGPGHGIGRALDAYDPEACGEAARTFRLRMGWENAIGGLLDIYGQVSRAVPSGPIPAPEASRAVSCFLENVVPELMRTHAILGKRFPPRAEINPLPVRPLSLSWP